MSSAESTPLDATVIVRPGRAGGLPTALATLYKLTLRQFLHGKRWMIMAALFLLCAGLVVLVRATAGPAPMPGKGLEFIFVFMFIPQALLPLVALMYASGMISDEQEEQTITYLLIRPIPKWAIYVVKLLATWTVTVLLTVVFTALTFAAIYVGRGDDFGDVAERCLKAAALHSLAVMTYCSLFGLVSLITKRTLIFGIVYTAVVEGVLANLPFGIRLATVIYYTRLIAIRTLDFVVTMPNGRTQNIADEAWQLGMKKEPDLLLHPGLSTCIVVLLGASLVCTVLAAWLCSRREFHVKTPDKE